MQDLSSLTKDWTHTLLQWKHGVLNHCINREVPYGNFWNLCFKEHHQESEKTTYRKGENISKKNTADKKLVYNIHINTFIYILLIFLEIFINNCYWYFKTHFSQSLHSFKNCIICVLVCTSHHIFYKIEIA